MKTKDAIKEDALDRAFPPDEKHMEQCELLDEIIDELKRTNERLGILATAMLKLMEKNNVERSKEPKRSKKAT